VGKYNTFGTYLFADIDRFSLYPHTGYTAIWTHLAIAYRS